jgi:hypothetical protein
VVTYRLVSSQRFGKSFRFARPHISIPHSIVPADPALAHCPHLYLHYIINNAAYTHQPAKWAGNSGVECRFAAHQSSLPEVTSSTLVRPFSFCWCAVLIACFFCLCFLLRHRRASLIFLLRLCSVFLILPRTPICL